MKQGQCVELADYILKIHNAGNCILKTFYKRCSLNLDQTCITKMKLSSLNDTLAILVSWN